MYEGAISKKKTKIEGIGFRVLCLSFNPLNFFGFKPSMFDVLDPKVWGMETLVFRVSPLVFRVAH